ncbi:uncharacterized protein LOC117805389 isoform X1 [Notolabrus celidotus]|uniref:uncharacterized protein LOC117805389 isoform X1 n=2 Tax=Notolabrus celidotus TaxID=1203425 RepID=UPI0014904696|nr:uncharacterized protein LOC117805389 isoform X1 [Notolabrus celidotus]
MPHPAGLRREKYLLSTGIVRVLDERYVELPRPGPVLQMLVTNLRNRPLCSSDTEVLSHSMLSLYHDLVTGSKDFPMIQAEVFLRVNLLTTPFGELDVRENTRPMDGPDGVMVPPAGSGSPPPNMQTPVLPERTDLGTLMADPDNCVTFTKIDDRTISRVISTVFDTDGTELTNRWRVTTYSQDGHLLMSVLCGFVRKSARYAYTPQTWKKRKRDSEEESQSPPKKHLRL